MSARFWWSRSTSSDWTQVPGRQRKDLRGSDRPGLDRRFIRPLERICARRSRCPTPVRPSSPHFSNPLTARRSDEGVLIISGGLTIHTFQDWSAWGPETASKDVLDFEASIVSASEQPTVRLPSCFCFCVRLTQLAGNAETRTLQSARGADGASWLQSRSPRRRPLCADLGRRWSWRRRRSHGHLGHARCVSSTS